MLIARYRIGTAIHYGVLEDDRLHRLAGSPFAAVERAGITDSLADAALLAPVEAPRIFGVGLNYVAHIEESGAKTPVRPLFFMKPSTTVVGPGAPIVYPREARNVHFEAELAVVIGRSGRRIAPEAAPDHVLGYTCANDVSERVIQKEEMDQGALLVGKGFDSFCPLGPVIATGLDPRSLRLGARVNGIERQSSSTADLLFGVAELVSYLSSAITLQPGDVIITGTPSGVGPVTPGDSVDIWVEGVGTLTNPVVAE
ncbi:fumarylacetoacetate hydrolase family protein [Aquibium microcysteis]|uniref:fumarylacetoacetate hydrolase family protein n=1 Tax=Aquibium microcysteis TaxID=675281 RepID=UPI00165D1091|nr:fumarylacetoacetate hydrolase family protein [Aquibium microcysteis]